MLNIDEPIQTKKDDFLNRTIFVENISKAIKNYEQNNSSLTIGFFGAWGSGKTSIINMTVETLEKEDNIIIFKFQPWLFSDTQQLVSSFFKEFAKAIKHKNYAKDAIKVGEELEAYATFFDVTSQIPEPTIFLLSLMSAKVFGSVGKASKKWGQLKSKNLSSTKESIEKHLKKLNKKILIIIDDIDRLNNTEIRQIFQMVKTLGDFPNTIYLCSMDKDIVVNALSKVQTGDGNSYLEKIIHVPFEIPSVPQYKVWDYLIKELNLLVDKRQDIDDEYLNNIFNSGIKYFFKTIRDVKRYINVLKFKISSYNDELCIADLIAITALEVFEPETYRELRIMKDYLLYKKKNYVEGLGLEKLYKLFNAIPKEKGEKLIQTIFPTIGELMGGYYEHKTYSNLRRRGRICTNDFFDSYFQMSFDDEILNSKMKLYISKMSSEESFRNSLTELIENKKIDRFLDRLQDFITDIQKKDFQNIFNVLIDLADTIPEQEKQGYNRNYKQTAMILNFLSHRLENKDDRFKLYKDAIIKSKNSIWISCWITETFMGEHGESEYSVTKADGEQTITQEQLIELKEVIKVKIQDWVVRHNLFEHNYGISIYFHWLGLDKDNANKYKTKQLKNNQQLLNLISLQYKPYYRHGVIAYRDSYRYFKEFIEPLELKDIAKRVQDIYNDLDSYEHTEETKKYIEHFLEQYEKETIKNNKSS